ncbi:MAG: cadherin repeat domain-containing protein [Sulfurovum sp.]|nr:cadherin repeat domain-containing protein [Sulfurovum sp.]
MRIAQYHSIDENASLGTSVGFVSIQSITDSAIVSFALEGNGSEHFAIDASGEIKLVATVDYETQNFYYLTTTATNGAGTSNRVDVNISIGNDSNDLYIQSAVLDDNATLSTSDDRVFVSF